MTIEIQTNSVREQGNGSKTAFDFSFQIYSETDVLVYKINSDGEAVLQTLNSDYTIEFDADSEGGTVTYAVAPTSTEDSFIDRQLSLTQPTVIPNIGSIQKKQLEKCLDRITIFCQQLSAQLSKAITFPSTSEISDITLPEPTAGKVLGWNDTEDGLENKTLEITTTDYPGSFTFGADASKSAGPSVGDIYFATDTNKLYKCISGGVWTTAMVFGHAVDFAKGADIASATTCNIGAATGNFVHITGTTTITGLGTVQAGTLRFVRFAGILTLTHNASSLILPSGASITTAAGDTAVFVSEGSGNWRCLSYQKADGKAIVETPEVPTPYTDLADTSTSDENTTSTSYVDTTLSLTFTPTAGLCHANFSARGDSSSGIAYIALLVDGTVKKEVAIPSGVSGNPVNLSWCGYLAASAHTIKIQIKGTGGGGCTLKGTDVTSRLEVSHPT